MLEAVFDSTTLVSAFLRGLQPDGLAHVGGGVSAELLRQAAGGVFVLSLSDEIIDETQGVLLERPHIRRRYRYSDNDVHAFCQSLRDSFSLTTTIAPVSGVVRDPNDDMVIACALAAQAAQGITRDDDLLALKAHQEIEMITPETFMALVRAR